jgi:PAS domain S-box-containing protein
MEKILGHEANILLKLSNSIFILDSNSFKIVACNQSFLKLLDYSQMNQVRGKNIEQLSPEYQPGMLLSSKLASGIMVEVLSKKSNNFYWVFNSSDNIEKFCQLTFSSDAEHQVLLVFAQDLSEIRSAEKALIKNQALLLSVINNSTDLIWSVDRNFRIIDSNRAAKNTVKELFGKDVVQGQEILDLFPPEIHKSFRERFERVLNQEQFTVEDEITLSDGILYLHSSFSPIILDDEVIGISCFSKNVTKEKANEAALLTFNERLLLYKQLSQYKAYNLNDFFDYFLSTTLKYTHSEIGVIFIYNNNDRTFSLLYKCMDIKKEVELRGIDKRYALGELGFIADVVNTRRPLILNQRREVNPSTINPVFYKLLVQINRAVFIPIFENGKLSSIISIINKNDDFTTQDVANLTNLIDSAWQLARNIEYKYDLFVAKENAEMLNKELQYEVNTRKRIEYELEIARNKAESANIAKSAFLANMSHEIRTPMNAIIGFTEILDEKIQDAELKSYIDSVKSSSKSLLTLINDVLDLSKVEAGKLELKSSFINIYTLFKEIESIFLIRLKEKGLNLFIEIPEDFPTSIYMDEIRLRQILINLVGNSVKFTNSGSITLKAFINNKVLYDSKIYVELCLEVIDTGIGISEEFQKELFNAFSQQDPSMITGSGLGLVICKKLAELMGGTIKVDSQENIGTTFKILLPKILINDDKPDENSAIRINPQNIRFKPGIIMLVEDDEENQKYFKSALRGQDIEVLIARNGKEALAELRKITPNLIVSDLKMPIMDGYQLIAKVKTISGLKDIPIVATTAGIMEKDLRKIENSKFDEILIKPYNITDLYLILAAYMKYETISGYSTTQIHNEEVQIDKDIINISGLISALSSEYYMKWESLKERQPINEVKIFANELIEKGNEHNCSLLINYGEKLINAVNSFDVESILKNIIFFPNLIEQIKKSNE